MCDYCEGYYTDDEKIEQIRKNDVPYDVFFCDTGWEEASRIWGTYGWARKLISSEDWRAVCKSRGDARAGL